MKATAKYLRQHSKEILDAVRRGEEVLITYRGKPAARLVPVANTRQRSLRDSPAFGIWKDHDKTEDVQRYVDELRRGRF